MYAAIGNSVGWDQHCQRQCAIDKHKAELSTLVTNDGGT